MPVVQFVFRHSDLAIRFEYHEIRIVAGSNAALVQVAPRQAGRPSGHPLGNIAKRESSSAGFRPHDWKRHRKARNAPPRTPKIALAKPFHGWRARRMVSNHEIDRSISEALPQSLAIITAANWRRTFA
jgi:hypothetical protein